MAPMKLLLILGVISALVIWLVHWASARYKPDD